MPDCFTQQLLKLPVPERRRFANTARRCLLAELKNFIAHHQTQP